MDTIMIVGIILLALAVLTFVGIRILPIKRKHALWIALIGVLIVTGLGATLWSGVSGLFTTAPIPATGGVIVPATYSYNLLPVVNSNYVLDETNKVILVPETYNSTAKTVNYDPIAYSTGINVTISVADSSNDMRGVKVTCDTPKFYTENESKTDSNLYMVTSKDTQGLPDIRVYDTADSSYTKRERTFLLGGEAGKGQTVTISLYADISPDGVAELDLYNSKDITCNIAGTDWKIRIQKSATTT